MKSDPDGERERERQAERGTDERPITFSHRSRQKSFIHCDRMVEARLGLFEKFFKMFSRLALVFCLAFHSAFCEVEFKHHNNTEMAAVMQQIHNACPDITRLYTLSETSVNGIPLYVLEITDNPGKHEACKYPDDKAIRFYLSQL